MAGSISDYLENKWLNHVLMETAFTQPTNLYLALSIADPGDDGGSISEPVGNNYARKICNTSWAAAAARAITTDTDITFNQATGGSWGTITHWALFDAITDGSFLAHGDFTAGKIVGVGVTPKVVAGDLTVTVVTAGQTTALANKLLDHTMKGTPFTQPTALWVGLSIADPTDDMSGLSEPGSNYARKQDDNWTVTDSAADNDAIITFVTATGSWGTVSHHFIADAITAGNYLYYGALDSSQPITTDDIVSYAAGALDITQQ